MQIRSCDIEGFGQFEKYSIDNLGHPLVVILGPNEAGKSTVFEFMATMLYGFSPADARKHPYQPAQGGRIGGTMVFRSGNSLCTVERHLKSTPKGVLSVGSEGLFGTRESIRNRPLRITGDVSREVFEAVYALSLQDMVQVSGRAWNSIQDRLLGGLNLDTLRISREVIEEIETEARKLWRSDRRGKTRAQGLRDQLRELRREAREARERDATIRTLSRQVLQISQQIRETDEKGRELRSTKNRLERLLPVKARLDRIEHLAGVAGNLEELKCIPADPKKHLEGIQLALQDVDAEVTSLQDEIRTREAMANSLSEADMQVGALAPQIRTWHSRLALFTQRRLQVDEIESKLKRLAVRQDEAAARLVPDPGTTDIEPAVRAISIPDLREALRRYARSRDELERVRARLEGVALRPSTASGPVWWAVLIVGLIIGVAGVVLGEPVVWGPAIAVAAVGAGFVLQSLASPTRRVDGHSQADAAASAAAQQARELVHNILADLPLGSVRKSDPDVELVDDIQTLQSILNEIDAEQAAADLLKTKLAEETRTLSELLVTAGMVADDVPEAQMGRLFDRLQEIERRTVVAEEAERSLPQRREKLGELLSRQADLNHKQTDLKVRLAEVGGGDVLAGIERATNRMRAAERVTAIREELEMGYPELESIKAEIDEAKGELPSMRDDSPDVEADLEEVSRALQQYHAEKARQQTRMNSLLEQKTVADVESEVSMIEAEFEHLRTDRDRLMLLAGIIRNADARFRDRHQPDVIRRASTIVGRLTSKRYSNIEVDEEDGSLSILEADSGRRVPVGEPLSRGTLDQIYLSLRIGLADHLDSSGDRLPMFLDEVLVNWDATRRRAACALLSELSESRQIVFFTCHEWLADEVEHLADAHIVRL